MNKVPQEHRAAFKAAVIIDNEGPKTRSELFSMVDFGRRAGIRNDALDSALESGWLIEEGSKIALSSWAADHLDSKEDPEPTVPTGEVAGPRDTVNVYDREPLKYRTNSRGDDRRQIDEQFQRAPGFHLFTVS